ncbi:MAG: hypothetical protein JRI72_12770, partial [Deltaproteobacteria bacterium]|nr:hypothetical protein [Deltaproteobacteria bacterium]
MDEEGIWIWRKKTINKEKVSARVIDIGIKAFSILGYHTSRGREYDFVMDNLPPKRGKVLDVGSTGSLLPLKLA